MKIVYTILLMMMFGYASSQTIFDENSIIEKYENIITGRYFKFPKEQCLWYEEYFSPDHTIINKKGEVEALWRVRNDTLFIWEDMTEFKNIPEEILEIAPILKNFPRTYTRYAPDKYPYPENLSLFKISGDGKILTPLCSDIIYNAVECSHEAVRNHIPYWDIVIPQTIYAPEKGLNIEKKDTIGPGKFFWVVDSVSWPVGLFTTVEIKSNGKQIEKVAVSQDSVLYNVMNPAAFRYPLAEPWKRWAEDWISEAGVGRAERLVLYPVDSISIVDIPVSELRYRRLNTEFMLNEARGYFIGVPLDSLETFTARPRPCGRNRRTAR